MPASDSSTTLLTPDLLARLEHLELVSRKIFRGRLKGERRSRRKGQSVEFMDFRSYVPGDDPRFIDWNLFARLDRLFLKLFLEEEDLHVYALIDASHSMDFGEPTKLQFAKQLAAAVGFIGLCRGDRVKIEWLGASRTQPGPAFRGRHQLWKMLQYVSGIEPGRDVPLASGLRDFCLRNTGKGILVFISDLLDKSGYESALRLVLAQQFDVYVVQVLAAEEIEPELQGDLRLIDCEDHDETEITVSQALLARYRRTLDAFVRGVQQFCARRGIGYLLVNNQTSIPDVVTKYLRERGLVR